MPKRIDFKKIVGGVETKPRQALQKAVNAVKSRVPGSLEREIRAFHQKPKPEREKASQGFEFKKLTKQIREKARAVPKGRPGRVRVAAPAQQAAPRAGGRALTKRPAAKSAPMPAKAARPVKRIGKVAPKAKAGRSVLERVPTGINGLDSLIEGGFVKGSSVLLVGSSGTGKTIFGQQFLYRGAKKYGEPGIFISFEEEREILYKHTASFGWDFESLEKKGLFKVLQYKPHHVEKLMAEGGGTIKDEIRAMGAKRLVIDSITSYALLFKDEYQKRENILDFFDMLGKWGCTSIIISELPPKLAEIKEGSVGFLTDAIISLYYSRDEEKGIRVHSCEILKMRGTKHTNKMLALGFEKEGLVIYPEVEVF